MLKWMFENVLKVKLRKSVAKCILIEMWMENCNCQMHEV